MCLQIRPSWKTLPAITAQDPTNLANKRLRPPSLQLFACSPEKHYWHIYLCQQHARDEETRASVSLYTYTVSTVWSHGAPDSSSYRHTSRHWELGAEFVIKAVLCIHSPLLSSLQRGRTLTNTIMDTLINTHIKGLPTDLRETFRTVQAVQKF